MTLNEILEGDISRNVKKRNINESLIKFKDRNTVWDRSSFKPLTRVSNDDKGEWGEDFIQNLISSFMKKNNQLCCLKNIGKYRLNKLKTL